MVSLNVESSEVYAKGNDNLCLVLIQRGDNDDDNEDNDMACLVLIQRGDDDDDNRQ